MQWDSLALNCEALSSLFLTGTHSARKTVENSGEYDDLTITQLINTLQDAATIEQFFVTQRFMCNSASFLNGTEHENTCFIIKYLDGINQLWRPRWARHCRGIIFLRHGGEWVCVKRSLQRGAEMLTGMHTQRDITDTQDIVGAEHAHLDDVQQDVLARFIRGDAIRGHATMKSDGSLVNVTFYTRGTALQQHVHDLIVKHGDEFNNLILAATASRPYMIVVASQATMLYPASMIDYLITSLAQAFHLEASLVWNPQTTSQQLSNLALVVDAFLRTVDACYSPDVFPDRTTLSFEAVCAHRVTNANSVHTELAISYPRGAFRFLGMTTAEGVYTSHCQIPDVVARAGWDEPLYWPIEHTREIVAMMAFLEDVLLGRREPVDFLRAFPPLRSGAVLVVNTPEDMAASNAIIDYEGFVFLLHNTNDYSKIKTPMYYMCHKFRPQHLGAILAMTDAAAAVFPIVRSCKLFYGNLDAILLRLCDGVMAMSASTRYLDDFPEKARASFQRQDLQTRIRMMINLSRPFVTDATRILVDALVPATLLLDEETESIVKNFVMVASPWSPGVVDRIAEMKREHNPILGKLFLRLV